MTVRCWVSSIPEAVPNKDKLQLFYGTTAEEYAKAFNFKEATIEMTDSYIAQVYDSVQITKKEYEQLCAESNLLHKLLAAGVDHWNGYEDCLNDEGV